MAITERTSKIVWGQCAARCCICKENVLHEEGGRVSSLVGEIAHIVGETRKASRGESDLSLEQRNAAENLLLLCRKDHKIVDDDPTTYPVERLHQIRDNHVAWIARSLAKPKAWRSTISQLTYINVPRLCELAELQGYQVDLRQYQENQTLHSLGWELNRVMSAFQVVLGRLSVDAVPMQSISLHEGLIGAPISFDRQRFRTKNVPFDVSPRIEDIPKFTGDLTKDAHVYTQVGTFRVVLFIDVRWVTTSTAFALFRPPSGQSIFSGLGRITGVDYETGYVTVTPWVLGLPTNPIDELLEDKHAAPIPTARSLSSLDALVNIERARRKEVYFHPPPTHCDLCRKSLAMDKYMIDGAVEDLGGWACMCAECFLDRGRRIAWGHGQLFQQEKKGWLEVAGFPPEDSSDDAF
jgi:hypothetical protein